MRTNITACLERILSHKDVPDNLIRKFNFTRQALAKAKSIKEHIENYTSLIDTLKQMERYTVRKDCINLLKSAFYNNLANAYTRLGKAYLTTANVQEGENYLKTAVDYYKKAIQSSRYLIQTLSNMATVYTDLAKIDLDTGNTQDAQIRLHFAIQHTQEALKINNDYAQAYNHRAVALTKLGEIYKEIGELYRAKVSLEKAINSLNKAIKKNPNIGEFYNNLSIAYKALGELYLATGETAKAKTYLEKAVDYLKLTLSKNSQNIDFYNNLATIYQTLAELNLKSGNKEAFHRNIQESIRLYRNVLIPKFPKITFYKNLIITLLLEPQILDKKEIKKILYNYFHILDKHLSSLTKKEAYYLLKNYVSIGLVLSFYVLEPKDIIRQIERFKSRVFVREYLIEKTFKDKIIQRLQSHRELIKNKINRLRIKQYKIFPIKRNTEHKTADINSNFNFSLPEDKEAGKVSHIKSKITQLLYLIKEIEDRILEKLDMNINRNRLNFKKVINDKEGAIYILYYKKQVFVATLYSDKKKLQAYKLIKTIDLDLDSYANLSFLLNTLLIPTKEKTDFISLTLLDKIQKKVATSQLLPDTKEIFLQYIEQLKDSNCEPDYNVFGSFRHLRNRLFTDVETALKNSIHIPPVVNTVVLLPIGNLNRLPLHSPFIENYLVNYLSTLKIRSIAISKDNKNRKALLIATENPSENHFMEEANAIKEILENGNYSVELIKNPLPIEVIERLGKESYEIVHFAVHGVYDHRENHLILGSGEKLSFSDIMTLNLDIDFVSMSSCETNTQKRTDGIDELNALEKAFLVRGARRVVSTFYSVFSQPAKEFSLQLYNTYIKTKDFREAFASAEKHLKRNGDKEYLFFRYADITKY